MPQKINEPIAREFSNQKKWAEAFIQAAKSGDKKSILKALPELDKYIQSNFLLNPQEVWYSDGFRDYKQSLFNQQLMNSFCLAYWGSITNQRKPVIDILGQKLESIFATYPSSQPIDFKKEYIVNLWKQPKMLATFPLVAFEKIYPLLEKTFAQPETLGLSRQERDLFLQDFSEQLVKHNKQDIFKFLEAVSYSTFPPHSTSITSTKHSFLSYRDVLLTTLNVKDSQRIPEKLEWLALVFKSPSFDRYRDIDTRLGSTIFQNTFQTPETNEFLIQEELEPSPQDLKAFFDNLVSGSEFKKKDTLPLIDYWVKYLFKKGLRQTTKEIEDIFSRTANNAYANEDRKEKARVGLTAINVLRQRNMLEHNLQKVDNLKTQDNLTTSSKKPHKI